jgi:hypothetical protein
VNNSAAALNQDGTLNSPQNLAQPDLPPDTLPLQVSNNATGGFDAGIVTISVAVN